MGKFDNVATLKRLGASVCELAVDLHKTAEDDKVMDALVVTRAPDGLLQLQHSAMDTASITEIATYLSAYAAKQVWIENESPQVFDEGSEECDED